MFKQVLDGTHYNRAWNIDSTFSEALEGLLMSRFIWDRNIAFSAEIKEYLAEGNCDAFDDNIVDILSSLATQYVSCKEKARIGELGKTLQCWLIYLDLIEI